MKKLIISFLLTCLSMSFFAQEINQNYPVGRYKFSLSEGLINISIGANNRWAFVLEEKKQSFDDESEGEYLQIRGSYVLKQDTLLFTPDSDYAPVNVLYKNSPDVEAGKIRIKLENFSSYSETLISVGNEYSIEKGETVEDIADNQYGESNDGFIYTTVKGDSLYISDYRYYRITVSAFPIPKNANDLIIKKNEEDMSELFSLFKAHKGENNNELMLTIQEGRRPESVSFFFISDKVDESLMQPKGSVPEEGYQFMTNPRMFTMSLDDDMPSVAAIPDDPQAVSVSPTTYNSYKDALKAAKKDNKYILLYYEPANKCTYDKLEDFLSTLSSYGKTEEFNQMFAYYQVNEKSKDIFDKYGLSTYPAMVVLNAEEEVIYKASNACIYDSFFSLFYSEAPIFKTGLEMQYINAILSTKIKSAKSVDKKQLEKYLNTITDLQKNDIDVDDVAYYFRRYGSNDDGESFDWNVKINFEETSEYLNLLVTNFYDKEKNTPEQISLVRNVLTAIDDEYQIVKENKLTPAFRFLTKAYENNADLENRADLFLFIVDKALYYRSSDEEDYDEKALYMQIIDIAPSTKELLIPFVIHYFSTPVEVEYDDLDKNAINTVTTYLDNFTGAKSSNSIDVYNRLYSNQYKELAYVLSLFRYADVNPDAEKEVLLNPYLEMLSSNFNSAAWFCYENVGLDKPELLQKALIWSEESLKIDPESPYYLDTYAHLLYRLGRKQEAIKYQEKAVENIDRLERKYQKINARNALILMKNDTLW